MRIGLERPKRLLDRGQFEQIVVIDRDDVGRDVVTQDVLESEIARLGHAVRVGIAQNGDPRVESRELAEQGQALGIVRVIWILSAHAENRAPSAMNQRQDWSDCEASERYVSSVISGRQFWVTVRLPSARS